MKNSSLRRELLWFVFAIGAPPPGLGLGAAGRDGAQRKTELRHVLDLASSIVQNGKRGVREGLTLEQAQRNVAQRLAQRAMAPSYVGAFRDDYSLLVHPDSKLVGTNVRDTRDAEGRPIFEDLYAQGAGGGYVDYLFPRPGSDEALHKISYAVYEPEWGWLVHRARRGRLRQAALGLAVVLLAALRRTSSVRWTASEWRRAICPASRVITGARSAGCSTPWR